MKPRPFALVWLAILVPALILSCSVVSPLLCGPLEFEPAVLPGAMVGVAYEARIHISQNVTPAGEFSISEGSLPPGLQIETVKGEDTARIFGTPEVAGVYKFKLFVWCYGTNVSGQTGEQEYTLIVK